MEAPREPPMVLESKPLESREEFEFESRRLTEEKIIAALNDDSTITIGITGARGVGKTRMARRIAEMVKRDKVFKVVMMVRVGRSSNLERIAYEISEYLGVSFQGRDFVAVANELLSKLILQERVLIILDDVRDFVDLERIGIPLEKRSGLYKIMITSRYRKVCLAMRCNVIFKVQALTVRDISILFSERFDNYSGSFALHSPARFDANETKMLPHASTISGRSFEEQSNLWPRILAENPDTWYRFPSRAHPGSFCPSRARLHSVSAPSYHLMLPHASTISGRNSGEQSILEGFANASGMLLDDRSRDVASAPLSLVEIFRSPINLKELRTLVRSDLAADLTAALRSAAAAARSAAAAVRFATAVAAEVRGELTAALAVRMMPKETQESVEILPKKINIRNHVTLLTLQHLPTTLQILSLANTDIKELSGKLKKLTNLRLLNLTNCRNLQNIESGLISSFVRLEELYMLGSFSNWEVEKEGKGGGNASINELEVLHNLTALQVQIRDPGIIPESSRIWSRLMVYVISTPKELICRYQESLNVSFPAVTADENSWQFQRTMNLGLPGMTSLADWICVLLRAAEYLCLNGVGSKNAVGELIPDGFKLLKRLDICQCSTMKYLVDEVPTNGLFPSLESLCLEKLPLFEDMFKFNCQLPVGLFRELRNLKLYMLPALLHVCQSQAQDFPFSNLRSIQISDCHKLRSLFPLSMAWDLMQLEEIKIEYCVMMEEIFSEQKHEDGEISNVIEFPKLINLELDTLPDLTDFCKTASIHFPNLEEMRLQSLRKFRVFCHADSDLPFKASGSNDIAVLFNEKVEFGSLKKMEITELQSATCIWSHQTCSSLFVELEVLEVISCDTLRHLFSHSIAKGLVKLEHLIVDDCRMMQEVIANESEAGEPEHNESLFPRLRKLKLRELPLLETFCNVMNDLELPSLEDLTLYNCHRMKEFSGGKLNMPVLRCVAKDSFTYIIDEGNYSIQHLFNEKNLFVHHSPMSGKYAFQEVEEIMEEDDMTEPIPSSQASGDSDFDAKNVHLISRQNTMKKENVAEFCSQDLGEKREEGSSEFYFGTIDGREIEEMDDKMKSEVYIETLLNNKRDFILFCSVFPLNYEFTKDILVWQWIAAGLIDLGEDEKAEEVCREWFDTLLGMHYIVPSGYDYSFDQMNYKIGDKMTTFFRSQLLEPKFGKYMDSEQSDPTKVEFLSMTLKEFNHVKSGVLELYSRLLTLVIQDCYEVDRLPSNLFLELKTLKTLNLSQTNIVYIPSSVGNLKELRFLDMSKTPIVGLPQAICDVSHLQTLRLDGCLQLRGLPKDTSKLINLRHLIIDVVHQLLHMPVGIGRLTSLQTLTAFLVDERDGCNVRELKDMNKLRGSFCLLNLQNVKTKEDASEACLSKKVHLRKIDLQWSDVREEKAPHEEKVLESLQPPLGIQELKILFYSGGVFPSWICNPSFSIVSMFLYECRYCVSLPSLGELPSLKHLSIIENEEVVEIDISFCRKKRNQYHHAAFPKLEKLTFESMSRLDKWTGLEKGDFPSLRHLIIEYGPEFVQLPNLEHLDSLSHLEIHYCPKLSLFPEDKLPPSLQSLMIKESPRLKEWCCDRDSSKIAHVLSVYFDNRKFPPDQM